MAAESRTALKSRRTLSRRVRERISVWRRLFVLNWNLFKASRIGVVGLAIMIAFVIIAFVVWRISKMFIKEAPEAPAAPTKTCPFCKQSNAVDASKCMHCASAI